MNYTILSRDHGRVPHPHARFAIYGAIVPYANLSEALSAFAKLIFLRLDGHHAGLSCWLQSSQMRHDRRSLSNADLCF